MTLSVHRYWNGPEPPVGEPFNGLAMRERHGDIRVMDWTDQSLPPDIIDWIDARAERVPEGPERRRHRANMVRWRLLGRYGGVWADHDVIPIIDLLGLERPFIAAHANNTVCTCIIGMNPGDPWAAIASAAIDGTDPAQRSTWASGDHLMNHFTPAEVNRIPLPFSHDGRRVQGTYLWAIHTFASTAGAPVTDPAARNGERT